MKSPLAALAVAVLFASPLAAQTTPSADKTAELERKIDALSEEVERLKLGPAMQAAPAAPAAAPWADRLTWGGYGEINGVFPSRRDQKGDPGGRTKTLEPRRIVLLGEYRFTDAVSFKTELEMEHGGTGAGSEDRGEFELEQAFLDFRLTDWLTARAGHLLVPMGLVNLWHEPPVFHGVQRPSVETFVIPSTWHETGAGFLGKKGVLEYQTYVVNGGKAVNTGGAPSVDGLAGSTGLRGTTAEGSLSPAEDFAWVSRLDLRPLPGALVGGSFYVGKADQGLIPASVPLTVWEAHGDFDFRGLELRGLYAEGRIGNAANVNAADAALTAGFSDFVGSKVWGGYAQAAYNVFASCERHKDLYLAPFFRYERYDTQAKTPDGFAGDPANHRVEYTAGLTFKPIPRVSIKLDQQWKRNQARTGVNQWDIGVGFMF